MAEIDERQLSGKVLREVRKEGVRGERPPQCSECQSSSWWNGSRVVMVIVAVLLAVERWAVSVPRAKCSCCRRGFSVRPEGLYPRRQYQLDVVAEVVAQQALGDERARRAAAHVSASPTSARRWLRWVGGLAEPSRLLALALQIEPHSPSGAGLSTQRVTTAAHTRVAQVLGSLEHVASALHHAGEQLCGQSGLSRVLHFDFVRHGVVHALRNQSPPMAHHDGGAAM